MSSFSPFNSEFSTEKKIYIYEPNRNIKKKKEDKKNSTSL